MLRDRGYKVYTVPLISTLTNESGGMNILSNLDNNGLMKFQVIFLLIKVKFVDLGLFGETSNEFGGLFHEFGESWRGKDDYLMRSRGDGLAVVWV